MSVADLEPGQVTCCPDIVPDLAPMNPNGLARSASAGRAYPPNASVRLASMRALHGMGGALGAHRRISSGPYLARTRRTIP
jgi:hypothetical protein